MPGTSETPANTPGVGCRRARGSVGRGRVGMDTARRSRMGWGLLGAAAAAWFAIWFLLFPQFIRPYFAWDIEPRFAQVFIGAGYVFRTAFFLNAAFERSWLRLRW